VVAAVRDLYPFIWISVSCTTRPPRPGEIDGVEYYFMDRAQFQDLIETGELLEWAEYAGNLYGTPREPVFAHLAEGKPALLEIELQGARQVRASMPDAQFVFLAPPSWEELCRRLSDRATEDAAVITARLARARIEMDAIEEFDAIVVNDDVRRAASELVSLIEAVCPPSGP